jgi:N-acylneuraminate cytidylyltransferase
MLGGHPLIVWSIRTGLASAGVSAVLVSTDDREIARVSEAAGALVPWLRPAELATDTASSLDVCLHALDWYEQHHASVDGVLLLQPTSPFRRQSTVERGLQLFAHKGRPVVGVSPARSHPMWCFRIEQGTLVPFVPGGGLHLRSQELPPAYVVNGAFYLISPRELRSERSFFAPDMAPLVIDDEIESLDIDTPWDWQLAELALARHSAEQD